MLEAIVKRETLGQARGNHHDVHVRGGCACDRSEDLRVVVGAGPLEVKTQAHVLDEWSVLFPPRQRPAAVAENIHVATLIPQIRHQGREVAVERDLAAGKLEEKFFLRVEREEFVDDLFHRLKGKSLETAILKTWRTVAAIVVAQIKEAPTDDKCILRLRSAVLKGHGI